MAAYTYAQLEAYWIGAGGSNASAPIAAAIALAESSGQNVIQQDQPYATTGWGLWQITPGNSEPSIGTDNQLLDPSVNAKAAVAKWKAAGQSFSPWTTYTSGKYFQFLQGNTAPAANTPASTTSIPGLSWPGEITSFFSDSQKFIDKLMWLVNPSSWLRIGAFIIGVALLLFAVYALISVGEGGPIVPHPNIVPVPI
jgi:Lysozyme like domain